MSAQFITQFRILPNYKEYTIRHQRKKSHEQKQYLTQRKYVNEKVYFLRN
jgi:hypothetical protein